MTAAWPALADLALAGLVVRWGSVYETRSDGIAEVFLDSYIAAWL